MKFTYCLTTLLSLSTVLSIAIPNADLEAKKVTITKKKTTTATKTATTVVVATITQGTTVTVTPVVTYTGTPETDEEFQDNIVNEHNVKRALHGVANLTWSSVLQEAAEDYAANYDCSSGVLVHSDLPYGENIALGYDTIGAVDAWYNEISLYNYSQPGFSEQTGHFTQLVWKSTTQLGCARVDCGSYYGQYTLCEYSPAGNVAGQYEANVLPLVN